MPRIKETGRSVRAMLIGECRIRMLLFLLYAILLASHTALYHRDLALYFVAPGRNAT